MSIKAELFQFFNILITWRILATIVSGAIAAMISTIICYPLDYARTQISGDTSDKYKGILHCWKTALKTRGLFSIYQGLGLCLFGDVIYRGLKYGLYDGLQPDIISIIGEILNRKFSVETFSGAHKSITIFFINWVLATIISALVGTILLPLDTVRRLMIMDSSRKQAHYQD